MIVYFSDGEIVKLFRCDSLFRIYFTSKHGGTEMKKTISLILAAVLLLCLCACGKATAQVAVVCKDESGAPLAGVKIQLCTDATCLMTETGSDGRAVFDMAPGEYEIHVYKVPEGFQKPAEDVVNTTAQDAEIEFVIPSAD